MNKTRQRPCYEQYALSAFRFYVRYPIENCVTQADRLNYETCRSVMDELSEYSRSIVIAVHANKQLLTDAVAHAAAERNIPETVVWRSLNAANKLFAQKRGLI